MAPGPQWKPSLLASDRRASTDSRDLGTVGVIGEGLAEKAALERRPDDSKDMTAWRSGTEGSWQPKEHVPRP